MDGGASEIIGGESPADLGNLESWWDDSSIAIWSFVLLGCFVLNATLLLAFLARPGLRTISNRFVMNLTVSNLLTCTILSPLMMLDGRSMGEARTTTSSSLGSMCAISEGVTAILTTSSVFSVLLIAIDQYFAVVDPLRYRSRIDKLKSGVLILSVWLVSGIFGLLGSLNPDPRSFWLSCSLNDRTYDVSVNGTTNFSVDSALSFFENETSTAGRISTIWEVDETIDGTVALAIRADLVNLSENSTTLPDQSGGWTVTYGLIYAIVHSVFAYLLPFAGVSWIYIRIYSAAHRNSERTRRTGSRPILSSGSFTYEETCGNARTQQQPEASTDDFRRIPKISSLSSIDETSETTQPITQLPRRHSLASSSSSSSEIGPPCHQVDGEQSSGIVFTVGSHRVAVTPQRSSSPQKTTEESTDRVPISVLKAEFLEKEQVDRTTYDDLVRSKFLDRPDQRRKSSHDLMYEDFFAKKTTSESSPREESSDRGSESESDAHFMDFDSLDVPEILPKSFHNRRRSSCRYLPPFSDFSSTINEVQETSITQDDEKEGKYGATLLGYPSTNCVQATIEVGSKLNDSENHEQTHEDVRRTQPLESCVDGRTSCRSPVHLNATDIIITVPTELDIDGQDTTKTTADGAAVESSAALLTPIVTITPAPNKTGLQRTASTRSTSSYINSLKYRISNGSLFKYREETRAARISALVIVMGLICWSPYVVLSILKNLPSYSQRGIPHEYDVLALSFQFLAAYISPLLFGYRSKRVKRELRKFFCFRRELSYKNNRSLMAKKVLKRRHSSNLSHLELDNRYNIFNCVYGRSRWPKEKVQFVQVPDTALGVETCRSSFSSGASTQISSTSTEEC